MSYYIGDFKKDSKENNHRGWLVGKFMETEPQKVGEVEIKYWEYGVGPTDHGTKIPKTFECTFILQGESLALIGNEETVLVAGQYVVIPPGTPNNLVKFINQRIFGLTVKAPSDPSAKQVIPTK